MLQSNQRTDEEEDAAAMDAAARASATHLVVFQHGLLGSEADFANVHALFATHFGPLGVYAHVAQCNATSLTTMFATCDGIDCGAERLATEIVRVAAAMPQLTKLSIVGHSMGGLYARYAIGILYARGFFERIEPVNFVTLATPHLGNRRPQRGPVNLLYNAIAPKLFDRTGEQFALVDAASDETVRLSQRVANKYPHRQSHEACQEMEGTLLVNISPNEAFRLHRLTLRDRVLSIYAEEPDASNDCIARVDLTQAKVTLVVPDKASSDARGDWEVVVQSSTATYTLRIPQSELASSWLWIPALSNASCALQCRSRSTKSAPPRHSPPLLYCLTRGQFMQALQLFRVRTLYATVFNDHTVPYSCAAVRAFNPYRHKPHDRAAALETSPYYDHIVARSLPHAPLLRNTLPLDAMASATRKSTANYLRTKELANQSLPPKAQNQLTTVYSSRPAPFADGNVLLDRVDDAFSTDDARDTLRAMLAAVQSVGWRRIDVSLDSLLAHEMIIAKRADIAHAPCDNGLDIVHHLLDTFVLA